MDKIDWENKATSLGYETPKDMIKDLIATYGGFNKAALVLEISRNTLSKYVRKTLHIRSPTKDIISWKFHYDSMRSLILAKMKEGNSHADIAKLVGYSTVRIKKLARKYEEALNTTIRNEAPPPQPDD